MEYKKVPTSPEVYAVIYARHRKDLKVFSSFSAPDGHGDPNRGVAFTEWGLDGSAIPLIGAETRWDIQGPKAYERHNEISDHWLCIPVADED